MSTKTYLTTAELAQELRAAPEGVRYWRHVGKGPAWFKIGRRVPYARSDVDTWIAAQRVGTTTGGGSVQ